MAAKEAPTCTPEDIPGDTPPWKLDQPCVDEHLCKIARHITDGPALAPLMGITAPEMEEIRGKWPFSVGGQRMEFMRKWKEKHGRKGTYRRLCKAFRKSGEMAVAEKVCDILCRQENISESSDEDEFFDALQYASSPDAEPQQQSSSERSSDKDENFPDIPQLVRSPDPKLQQSSPASSSFTPAATAIPSDPLETLTNELRVTYGRITPSFIALQWSPPPTRKVFKLALIQDQETVRVQPLDETLVRLTVTGNIDDVMKMKTSIELKDLFQGQDRERKVVLVEGAPGSGKSTLANNICQKWETRELFHDEFKVVIYVQFQDLEIADLFPMEFDSERRAAASLLEACCGERVLFVLDGWDEYTSGLQQGSLFEKLICRSEMLNVQLSTVLITSRPITSGKLQPYATSRVEIVGFTPEEVGRYFQDIFKDILTLQKLNDRLQERPLIKASCYLLLNAAIVAHLFKELNYTLPTTLHGLFSSRALVHHSTFDKGIRDRSRLYIPG